MMKMVSSAGGGGGSVIPFSRSVFHIAAMGHSGTCTRSLHTDHSCNDTNDIDAAIRLTYTELHVVNLMLRWQQHEEKEETTAPLDVHVARYLRQYPRIGTNQRKMILQIVYDIQRWLLLVDHLAARLAQELSVVRDLLANGITTAQTSDVHGPVWESIMDPSARQAVIRWRTRYFVFCEMMLKNEEILQWITTQDGELARVVQKLGSRQQHVSSHMNDRMQEEFDTAPDHVKVSYPSELFDMLRASLDSEQSTMEFCRASNTQAPTCVRMNLMKIESRPKFIRSLWSSLKRWSQKTGRNLADVNLIPTEHAPHGVIVQTPSNSKINFRELDIYQQGMFEAQDEASQLIAHQVEARPDDIVFDYCAGSGGKSLAIAYRMLNKGQLYLTDIRYAKRDGTEPSALYLETERRLKRNGISNAILLPIDHPELQSIRGRVDWLLLDVPCSGTGTLRRHPALKYRIGHAQIAEYVKTQREIIDDAVCFLDFSKSTSRLVYATCSILWLENMNQVEYILNKYGDKLEVDKTFSTVTKRGGYDGFFSAVFRPRLDKI